MNKLSTAAKSYFKEVKKHLSCSLGKKKIYIDYIKDQVDQDVLYDENLTYEKLTELLGEPEKVATGFDLADPKEMKLRSKIYSLSVLVTIFSVVIAVLLAVVLLYVLFHLDGNFIVDIN